MSLLHELRPAARGLLRSRRFALPAIATLALGLGACTAMLAVARGVLLRDWAYAEPDRLVVVWRTSGEASSQPHSAADFLDLQKELRTLGSLAGHRPNVYDISGSGEPQRLDGAEVTLAFFDALRATPGAGRTFSAGRDKPGDRLVVLREDAARRLYGSEAATVGKIMRLGAGSYEVTGVLPVAAAWPADAEAWVLSDRAAPSSSVPSITDPLANRGLRYFEIVARLQPGATLPAAQEELSRMAEVLARAHPENNSGRGYRVVLLADDVVAGVRDGILMLIGAVALLLVIAVANVAGLLVARGLDRSREMAVRSALGASPGRLLRLCVAEALVLCAAGIAVGAPLAVALTRALLQVLPEALPAGSQPLVDLTTLLGCAVVVVAAALAVAVLPAWQSSRRDTGPLLRSSRGALGTATRARRLLVAGQVALAVVVLTGSALLLRSLVRLQAVDTGFRTTDVVVVPLPLPSTRYADAVSQAALYERVLSRLQQAPGVEAALGFPSPMGPGSGSAAPVQLEGEPLRNAGDTPMAKLGITSPGWFRVMGIPLLRGRDFEDRDTRESEGVVIVSDLLARRQWPGRDPLGQRVKLGSETVFTVVGVVGDVHRQGLDQPAEPGIYLPWRQFSLPRMHVAVRGTDAGLAGTLVRTAAAEADPALAVGTPERLDVVVSRSLAAPRFRTGLLAAFGVAALLLSAVGLYAATADAVGCRRPELAVRLALGAEPERLRRAVLGDALAIGGAGVAVGLLLAVGARQAVSSLLYGVDPADPLTLAAASATLLATVAVAAFVPARQAARVQPAEVLKGD